ncbi:MAG: acyl carrier protein [Lachnospiraceae bacterium]|nr:acyl carrier protein [Lachnospiraceae bacterium]
MKEKVLEILCQVNPKVADNVDADLLETGIIDSFEIVNIVMELEEAFNIEIDPELITSINFQTVNAIVDMIESLSQ